MAVEVVVSARLMGTLSYVDVTVCSLHQTEILFADTLTLSSELCDSTEWSRLRRLTTSVRVNLSIEYQDVNILTRSQYVVETTVTDIIRSTVTTDDPL